MNHPRSSPRPEILSTSIASRGNHGAFRLVAIGSFALLASLSSSGAFTVTESNAAPAINILTSQLTDSTGAQVGNQDFTDNGGPPGQTFSIDGTGSFRLDAFTVLGRGDANGSSGVNWSIQIGSVDNATGAITPLLEDISVVSWAAKNTYLTFTLAAPVLLNAGSTYSFSLLSSNGWYGFAHSAEDVYAGGTSFNNNQAPDQPAGQSPARVFNGFASPHVYDFVFAVQGSAVASSKTWSGTVNGNWDNSTANFSGQTFAGNDDNLIFGDLDGLGAPPATRDITIRAGGVTPGAAMSVANSAGDYTFTGSLNGTTNNTILTKTGTGSVTLSGNTDNPGLSASVVSGALLLNKESSATVHAVGNLVIGSGGTVKVTGLGGDQIANTATVTAAGMLDLNGANEEVDALGGGGIVTNNGEGTASILTIGSGGGAGLVFNGAIKDGTGTVSLVKAGPGNATLSGKSNFSGDVSILAGKLTVGGGFSNGIETPLGQGAGTRRITVHPGAAMEWTVNNIFIGGGGVAANLPTIVVDGGTFHSSRFNVVGNLELKGGALTQASTDNGNYQGFQFIGDVIVSGTAPSTISSDNGKLNHLPGGIPTGFMVADVTGSAASDLTISAGLADGSGDYQGTGSLTKLGSGTLALTGISSYTGPTNIDEGTLVVTGSIAGSAVNVAPLAALSGSGTVGPVTVLDNGVVAPGQGVGTLNTGSFSLGEASVLKFELSLPGVVGGITNDLIAVSGDLTLDGTLQITELPGFTEGTFQLFSYTGALTNNILELAPAFMTLHPSARIDFSTAGAVFVVVPEPNVAMALLGGLGMLLGRRRSRKASVRAGY